MGSMDSPVTADLLQDALDDAVANYTRKHSASKKHHDEACLYMPGGNTRTSLHALPFPLTIASASGCHLTTADGVEYIDFLGEFTAGIYGHSNPVIRQAVEKALDNGWNYGGQSKLECELAKRICTRFPAMEMVRFVNSGTEANMMALASAIVASPSKGRKVLVFQKAYHGSTISGLPATGSPNVNLPHDFVLGQYNDPEGTKSLVASLPSGSLAAILVEPMIGSGGCFSATPGFLKVLRELATEHKATLIFDEVMTSRLGYRGYGSTFNIKPDLMTVGKYLGGGMTFGAFGGREDLMSLYDPRKGILPHAGTFNNNVFTMHAGIAGSDILTPETLSALNELGTEMASRVNAVLKEHGLLMWGTIPHAPITDQSMHNASHHLRPPKIFLKGQGSLMTMHFAGPDQTVLQGLFYHHMLEQGIYIAQRGFIALNLQITEQHVKRFVSALDIFCRQWHAALQW